MSTVTARYRWANVDQPGTVYVDLLAAPSARVLSLARIDADSVDRTAILTSLTAGDLVTLEGTGVLTVTGPPTSVDGNTALVPVTSLPATPPAVDALVDVTLDNVDNSAPGATIPPTRDDLIAYLGTGYVDPGQPLTEALAAALASQESRCVIEPYTAALYTAGLRRAAAILAATNAPLGVADLGDLGASLTIPRWDAITESLEAPYLRPRFA